MTITPVPDQPEIQPEGETFQSFADTMPETAQGFLDAALPPMEQSSASEGAGFLSDDGVNSTIDAAARPRKRIDISKKMRKAMNKFRGKISSVPVMWFHAQAKANPEWELDDTEKELIEDAIDTVLDVLDIQIEIEALSMTLTSIWWVISYPVLVIVFLFLTKKSLILDKEKQATEE